MRRDTDNVKGADGLYMPANHKFFLVDKARQIKQRMNEKKMADERAMDERIERSLFICRSQNRDPTASEIDKLGYDPEDHVSYYINTVTRSNTKRTFDETNESMVGEAIEVDDATNERCAPCSDVEDEENDEIAALCGNGGAERAAKPGPATPVNYPFRVKFAGCAGAAYRGGSMRPPGR